MKPVKLHWDVEWNRFLFGIEFLSASLIVWVGPFSLQVIP